MKTAAIVLAAGQGTRMKSPLPKVLHHAAGLPLVAYPLLAAKNLQLSPLVVVVGHGAPEVRLASAKHAPGAVFALQAEQKGTAHAVQCAVPFLGDAQRVVILYGDCPLLTQESLNTLLTTTAERGAALGLITAVVKDPTGYGRLVRNAVGQPDAVVEHKDCTPAQRAIHEVNAGIYVVTTAFLLEALARVGTGNVQREFYLPDVVNLAAQRGPVVVHTVDEMEMLGVNTRVELAQAEGVLQQRLRTRAMLGGCTLRDPATTFLDATVTLDADVVLGPGVTLRGNTHLASGVTVEGPCVVVDSTVGQGATLKAFSHLEGARVGAHAVVGPFARLRPEAVLEEDVHVGNFVEVKKSTLRRGAKANHLAYVGDADVGEKSNVGAGTITCNYDGVGKYRTVIGRDVFIGSNSTLVAPVDVGDGAYVAAGSVITDAVPQQALALGRARQTNKEGRAENVRQAARAKAKR